MCEPKVGRSKLLWSVSPGNLPLRLLEILVDRQIGTGTTLGARRIAVVAGFYIVTRLEIAKRQAAGKGIAAAGGVDHLIDVNAFDEVFLHFTGFIETPA